MNSDYVILSKALRSNLLGFTINSLKIRCRSSRCNIYWCEKLFLSFVVTVLSNEHAYKSVIEQNRLRIKNASKNKLLNNFLVH